MTSENIFAAICILTVLIMMIYYIKRERKLLSFLFGAVTGTAALILLNKYGAFIGIDVPLNIFNVSGSRP